MKKLFTSHPSSVGETYFEHMQFALVCGMRLFVGGLACLIHAFLPFLFEKTGSDMMKKVLQQFLDRHTQNDPAMVSYAKALEERR